MATNGGSKNTKREQDGDIKLASSIRDQFLSMKEQETTRLRYIKIKL